MIGLAVRAWAIGRRWFQPSMSRPKPCTSLFDLTSVLLLGKYQPPHDESEGEGGSVSEWECGWGWLGETVWLGLRENEVKALRDIRALKRERWLELREVQRHENRVRDLRFAISEIYIGRYFSNFILSLNGLGRVRVRFFPKSGPTRTHFGFFVLNPYPTLFLIGLGKIRPIMVGPGRVLAGWAWIAIPTQ